MSGSNLISAGHPKLIKTIGNPRYGNVQCSLQDKAGNVWFGTTQNGLYKYDGKSVTQFLVADGINSNSVYSLLEDKEGKIWIGTEAGLCIYDPSTSLTTGGKTFAEIKIPLPKNLPTNNNPTYRNAGTHNIVFMEMVARNKTLTLLDVNSILIIISNITCGICRNSK